EGSSTSGCVASADGSASTGCGVGADCSADGGSSTTPVSGAVSWSNGASAEGDPAEGAPGAAASSARVRSGADEAGTVVCVVSAPASAPAGAAGFAGAGAESVSSQVGAAGRSLTAVEARCAPVPAGSVEVPSAGVVSSPGRLRPRLRRYAQAPAPITSTP